MTPKLYHNNLFKDNRGYFMETYKKKSSNFNFVQDNLSYSKKGVIRGLHYQYKYPQTKLLSVIKGKIFDVAVDIRKKSKNFGKVYKYILNDNINNQLLIPRGFAHGFQCLSSDVIIYYKCDNFYAAKDQYGIVFNDNILNIDWPIKKNIIISKKDKKLPNFSEDINFF